MFARLIVQHHMAAAQAVLLPFKILKNPKIKVELEAVLAAWSALAETAKRDDSLSKLQTKVSERSEQVK